MHGHISNSERFIREAITTLYAYRTQAEYYGQKKLARKYIKQIKDLELKLFNMSLEVER